MEHPNLAAIETERKALFAKLEAAQEDYGSRQQHYLQCLLTPAAEQSGSDLASFDRARKAGHETEDWSALISADDVLAGTRCQYYVHRYDGPAGAGFVLCCRVVWDGKVWVYQEHHGPERRSEVFDEWVEVVGHGE